jgi:hypothetical protein
VVSGLVGYLLSLPSVRKDLNFDRTLLETWSTSVKKKVVDLATEARQWSKTQGILGIVANSDLLTAYNGINPRCDFDSRKRDDIPGDPFSQTVCIQLLCSV